MAIDYDLRSTSELEHVDALDLGPLRRRIPFLQSLRYEDSVASVTSLLNNNLWSQKSFRRGCERWLRERYGVRDVWMTSSCSQSFYLAAAMMKIKPGDEVILPSYTHPSTANAFAEAGASLVFVDIDPRQMVIDPQVVAEAISPRTRAIIAVHYGGFATDMHQLASIAEQHSCLLIEDAAHALLATQGGKLLGTFGHLSCLSFEQQKNISCGEGGALLVSDPGRFPEAELIYEAGTNKAAYLRGETNSYSWLCVGAKYAPSELTLAQLWAGFRASDQLMKRRKALWNTYQRGLYEIDLPKEVQLPEPTDPGHNAHLYYLLLRSPIECLELQSHLCAAEIETHTHYVPLHNSPYGRRFQFSGEDIHTTSCSQRLLRLPLHAELSDVDVLYVIQSIASFFRKETTRP